MFKNFRYHFFLFFSRETKKLILLIYLINFFIIIFKRFRYQKIKKRVKEKSKIGRKFFDRILKHLINMNSKFIKKK